MHAVNHKEITRNALIRDTQGAGRIIQPDTLRFIRYANADSDECSTGKSYIPQHFQNDSYTYESEASITKALGFFESAYDKAWKLVRNGEDEKSVTTGLYFLGRALHCIQDFYAHSSWIFIQKNIGVWTY